jgi:hypothetical protein
VAAQQRLRAKPSNIVRSHHLQALVAELRPQPRKAAPVDICAQVLEERHGAEDRIAHAPSTSRYDALQVFLDVELGTEVRHGGRVAIRSGAAVAGCLHDMLDTVGGGCVNQRFALRFFGVGSWGGDLDAEDGEDGAR